MRILQPEILYGSSSAPLLLCFQPALHGPTAHAQVEIRAASRSTDDGAVASAASVFPLLDIDERRKLSAETARVTLPRSLLDFYFKEVVVWTERWDKGALLRATR